MNEQLGGKHWYFTTVLNTWNWKHSDTWKHFQFLLLCSCGLKTRMCSNIGISVQSNLICKGGHIHIHPYLNRLHDHPSISICVLGGFIHIHPYPRVKWISAEIHGYPYPCQSLPPMMTNTPPISVRGLPVSVRGSAVSIRWPFMTTRDPPLSATEWPVTARGLPVSAIGPRRTAGLLCEPEAALIELPDGRGASWSSLWELVDGCLVTQIPWETWPWNFRSDGLTSSYCRQGNAA